MDTEDLAVAVGQLDERKAEAEDMESKSTCGDTEPSCYFSGYRDCLDHVQSYLMTGEWPPFTTIFCDTKETP